MEQDTLVIEADGGCVPNPGKKYGSYSVSRADKVPIVEKRRVDMGDGTSNEAELDVLVMAAEDTVQFLAEAGLSPSQFSVIIYSDSENACKYINRGGGACDRLDERAKKCLGFLSKFAIYHAHWRRRHHSVERFGH